MASHPRPVLRAPAAALVAAVVALAVVACGPDEQEAPDGGAAAPGARAKDKERGPVWPLTGLPVKKGSADRRHPVYIAKIDNTPSSSPQVGLGKADMVVEELVEGGITRLAAFYYSDLPKRVGPVRSMRLTDIGITKPAEGHLVTSGAASITIGGLVKARVPFINMSNPNVARVSDGRPSLYSVMADLSTIGREARRKPGQPKNYFPWRKGRLDGGGKARTIHARLSTARTSTWKLRGRHYNLQNGYMPKGDRFRARTVIVCRVRTSIAPYRDPAGSIVPVSHFQGHGKAWIFHDGKVQQAIWHKRRAGSPVTFSKAGGPIGVPAGKAWVELIPGDGPIPSGDVTWSK